MTRLALSASEMTSLMPDALAKNRESAEAEAPVALPSPVNIEFSSSIFSVECVKSEHKVRRRQRTDPGQLNGELCRRIAIGVAVKHMRHVVEIQITRIGECP